VYCEELTELLNSVVNYVKYYFDESVIQGCVVVQDSPCRGFDPMPVHMGYFTDKVAHKQFSVRVFQKSF
jgi:hypothetical protein